MSCGISLNPSLLSEKDGLTAEVSDSRDCSDIFPTCGKSDILSLVQNPLLNAADRMEADGTQEAGWSTSHDVLSYMIREEKSATIQGSIQRALHHGGQM